jgi:hypothetical protein
MQEKNFRREISRDNLLEPIIGNLRHSDKEVSKSSVEDN